MDKTNYTKKKVQQKNQSEVLIIIETVVGSIMGYLGAELLADDIGPVEIEGIRIHHYWALVGTLLTNNPFIQGLFLGAGIHDIHDLIKAIDGIIDLILDD